MAFRTKGQNAKISMLVDNTNAPEVSSSIKDFSFELGFDIQKEGYLGEKSDRRDQTYNGVTGKFTFHYDTPATLQMLKTIRDKAKDPVGAPVFSISALIEFADGNRTVSIPDVSFSNIPVNFSGRAEYNSIDISFEATDFDVF